MELKNKYKDREINLIPNDWQIVPLEEVGQVVNGLTYTPKDVCSFGILVLRSSNIQNDVLAFEDNIYVCMEVPEHIMVRPGDILICVRNGSRNLIGKTALLDDRTKGMAFGAFMAVFRSNYGQYINYLFRSHILKRQIDEHLGATINQITNKSLKSFHIPIPPTDEEINGIATALSNVDALLDGLDRLIAKKRNIKQAAMQQLLTGKTRLPGFEEEWVRCSLPTVLTKGDGIKIGPFGSQLKKEYLVQNGSYRVYGQENVYQKDFFFGARYLTSKRFEKLKSCEIKAGDFVISTMGTIGKCAIVPPDIRVGIMDSHLIRLRIDQSKLLSEYLLHLFSDDFNYLETQTKKLSVGGIMEGLSTKIVRALDIDYPKSPDEQSAIVTMLSDMDAEIEALE
ncbi:MAG TPA: restriction endonuclease subunit S, partial [Gammaproteobacteria bacterium]|nr:restriction endonuclease subunit S [Gammaproteobacteria bacterium]